MVTTLPNIPVFTLVCEADSRQSTRMKSVSSTSLPVFVLMALATAACTGVSAHAAQVLQSNVITPDESPVAGPHFQTHTAEALFPEHEADSPFLPATFPNHSTNSEPVAAPDLQSEMEFNRPLPSLAAPSQNSHRCSPPDSCGEEALNRFRKGFFQGAAVSTAYLHDDSNTGLAITSTDVSASVAIPLGSFDNLLVATPFLRTEFLNAADTLNLPDEVHETGARFFWKRPVSDHLSLMAIVTPAMRTDFRNTDNAFRIFGLGLLIWEAVPDTLSLSGGVVHTGRDDFPLLPAAGLLWTPVPEWKIDLQFPSPRISYRLRKDGGRSETWAYLSGVFGGNTWAIQRPSGANDELTLRDYRLISGFEHLLPQNRSLFLEGGFVFGRVIEFEFSPDKTELDSAGIIRCGIAF